MRDNRARLTVEEVSRSILDAAKSFRERATAALAEGLISQSEFDESVKLSDEHAKASATWWLTGDGPAP